MEVAVIEENNRLVIVLLSIILKVLNYILPTIGLPWENYKSGTPELELSLQETPVAP